MAANMYRVGDYVYFETSSTTPYQIRRIEELNKTPNGNVEAKVMCFYRRRDISSSLILLADKHQKFPFSEASEDSPHDPSAPSTPTATSAVASSVEEDSEEVNDDITEKQRHQLKHRELFLSRQVETLPATHIRGKCVVTLLNETESLLSYLNKEDTFFYSLVYDPQQKTLLADKGEIRVGSKFQAEITPLMKEGEEDGRNLEEMEQLIWLPGPNNTLTPKEIDQFLILARSVGTFARALDCTSTVRQPSLHMSAAAASRDVTLFHAMDTLHKSVYDIAKAVTSLVPQGGPVLCRDEMEEWSASEANLFEEALDKYGKDFNDIRQDFLPWKSLKSIIEYYYMWKTTDRYVQQKRIKAAEAESKLKQVYIPNYNKPNPAAISGKVNGVDGQVSGRACESCYAANSSQWYSWGPAHMQCRLCSSCWIYWKKYGGLKMPTRLDHKIEKSDAERIDPMRERLAHLNAMRMHRCTIAGCGKEFKLKPHLARHLATAHGLAIRAGSPRPMMKTRAAFCLITTRLTRISRRLCKDILRPRHAARCPFIPINIAAIKQESAGLPIFQDGSQGHLIDALTASTEKRSDNNGQLRLTEGGSNRLSMNLKAKPPATLEPIVSRLGIDIKMEKPSMFNKPEGDQRKQPQRLSFPPVSSPMTTRLPEVKPEQLVPRVSTSQPSIMKKRGYEQSNGLDGPPAKRQGLGVIRQAGSVLRTPATMRGSVINRHSMNGRSKTSGLKPTRMHMISWIDAPDDVYFLATDTTRKLRRQLLPQDFKRAARNPWRVLPAESEGPQPPSGGSNAIVILD